MKSAVGLNRFIGPALFIFYKSYRIFEAYV